MQKAICKDQEKCPRQDSIKSDISREKPQASSRRGTPSGTEQDFDKDLGRLIAVWPNIVGGARQAIMRIVAENENL